MILGHLNIEAVITSWSAVTIQEKGVAISGQNTSERKKLLEGLAVFIFHFMIMIIIMHMFIYL